MKFARVARQRRVVSALVAGLLMASGLVWAAQPSLAATCTTVGGFEVDGNMDAGTCGGSDWGSAGSVQSTTSIGTYGVVKDNSNPNGWSNGGGTPPKVDFQKVYAFTQVVGGHYDAYVGWERSQNSGTGGYSIEIDNAATNTVGGVPQPNRSQGGFVFYITVQGSSPPQLGEACAFTSQATYPGTCTTSTAGYNAAINDAAITDPLSGVSVPQFEFLEIGLDVTQLTGIAPACPAPAAASLYMRSFTGNNIGPTGNLKGYVAPFAVAPNSTCVVPPMNTTATPGGSQVAPGTSQHDVATLDAVGNNASPTGSVAFYLCQPAHVTAEGCPTGFGVQVGASVALAAGSATSSNSTNDTTLGKYCWRAEYTPDAAASTVYLPTTHTNATTECFTVVHASPTLTTQVAITGASPPALGLTTLGDSATLAGFLGSVAGQTVTFNLYGPYADGVTPTCAAGANVFTTTGTLSAAGVATASQTYTPTAAGTYVWQASYAGNPLNDPATDACNEATEKATIVGATIDVSKSANPPGPVSAGDGIGFDITVHNSGNVPATGVVVTDNLPAGGDLDWSLSPAFTGCSITGAVGSEVLTCNLSTLAGGASAGPIHVTSATSPLDCGVVTNKATVSTTNGTGGDSDNATVSVLCADVSLTKTADAASVSAGAPIGFTVTASNSGAAGTGVAKGVVIDDPLPGHAGIDWSIASGPANCSIVGSPPNETLHCTAVDLAAGASESVHVTSATVFASCATYNNTATLTANNTGTLTADASTQVKCPNLSITKTADPGPVNAGTSIGFTVTAHNAGAGDATGALVSDTLPTGSGIAWTIDAANTSGPLSCGIASGVLTCTGTLGAGATETVHITSPTTFASCGTYDNTATLSSTVVSTITSNPVASVDVLCADLGVTKKADAASVNAGESIGFTVTAGNTGAGDASGALVHDALPTGPGITWTIDAANTTGPLACAITSNVLSCTGTLGAGGTEVVHITSPTVFASCDTYDNTAQLSAANAGEAVFSETVSTTVNCPALAIEKVADDASVSAGTAIGFGITAHNTGAGDATGAVINDPLPTGDGIAWSIDSATGPLTCGIAADVLSCTGTLGAGEVETVHISSDTVFASCGTYDNTATLTAQNGGEQAPQGSASTTVECPDVSLTKTADAATVNAGEGIGFTVTASNADGQGTGTATDVAINDPLPGGNGIEWSIESGPPNCAITGAAPDQVLACSAVDLGPGDTEVVHLVSGTAFVSCATYDNTATLSLSNGPLVQQEIDAEPVPATLTASASTEVQCAALAITKVADDASVNAGDALGFTVNATNAGPGTAVQAVIEDPLPTGKGVSWAISPAYTGPGACVVGGTSSDPVLVCELGDLAAGADVTVHVTSATTDVSCAVYDNTATLLADNAPSVTASASATVANCAGVLPEGPVTKPKPQTGPLAETGAGPLGSELGWAVGLVVLGGLLLAATRRRRTDEQ